MVKYVVVVTRAYLQREYVEGIHDDLTQKERAFLHAYFSSCCICLNYCFVHFDKKISKMQRLGAFPVCVSTNVRHI